MSSIHLSGDEETNVDMSESLVDQELGTRSTTGLTDELNNSQLEVNDM